MELESGQEKESLELACHVAHHIRQEPLALALPEAGTAPSLPSPSEQHHRWIPTPELPFKRILKVNPNHKSKMNLQQVRDA